MVSRTYAYQAIEKREASHYHLIMYMSCSIFQMWTTMNWSIPSIRTSKHRPAEEEKKCLDDIILLDEYCWHLGVSVC